MEKWGLGQIFFLFYVKDYYFFFLGRYECSIFQKVGFGAVIWNVGGCSLEARSVPIPYLAAALLVLARGNNCAFCHFI